MTVKNGNNAHSQLRTLFHLGAIGSLSDGQLLERFAAGLGEPKELAFAALVERHGPLVLRVCRSILRDEGAAEDAFQATFLALARKAGSLWTRDSLAPWLHQAAYRAAIHDRAATLRRRSREHSAALLRPESAASPRHDDDLVQIIHEEIDRLPGRFRVVVVLCDLEGRTQEQAARHLGCAVGTVKSRLSRGRERLRGRLERRGAAPSLAAAVASTSAGAARAAVPAGLARATVVHAAMATTVPASIAEITGGVLMSMMLNKARFAIGAATVAAAVAAGVALRSAQIFGPTALDRGVASPAGGQGYPKVVLTALKATDITVTLRYVCQIHARKHINICALDDGRIDEISVKEGQAVKTGDPMLKIATAHLKAKLDAEMAEAELARLEYENVKNLAGGQKLPERQKELAVAEAKLAKANARLQQAKAELDFANIRAPFDGTVGRLEVQPGGPVKAGDNLTTLSDNSVMWVYFNLPEKYYLESMANPRRFEEDKYELELSGGAGYPQPGKLGAIESEISNQTGNIAFRADFPNPNGVLQHDQSGIIMIRRKLEKALVVPVRATVEILDKRYVYVVDQDAVAHRREIVVQNEVDDHFVIKKRDDVGGRIIVQNAEDGRFVIKKGVEVGDRIILDGVDRARDGEKVDASLGPQP